MTHEPECQEFRRFYEMNSFCICHALRAAYRRGYNDHARAQQHWRDTHGAYRQHGEGTNP
jgi:hypothetical protein